MNIIILRLILAMLPHAAKIVTDENPVAHFDYIWPQAPTSFYYDSDAHVDHICPQLAK